MLQTIRERTQGWIAGIIITIIILTFALWGIHSYFIGGANNSVVASVNGVDITREQLSTAYERLRRQMQIQYRSAPISVKDESTLRERALQSLVDLEVLKQASLKQGFRISDRQVDNYLQGMPEFQVNGQFSLERFQELLSSTLLSISEFLELIRTSLLIDQPKLGVVFTSFALPDETNYTIALVNQERDIEYINVPLSYFLSQPIQIAPDKIQAYYNEHKNDFMTPEQVNVEYIELSIKDLSDTIKPTDTMLKSFYNENINSYTQPLAWKLISLELPVPINATPEMIKQSEDKIKAASQALAKGEETVKVARQYGMNQDEFRGQEWMTLNQVPAELQKSAAQLTKAGQVSEIIRSNKGFVIVKAIDVREPKIESFEMVKDKVRDTYVRQHAEEKFARLREQLADLTYEHPDTLQSAAKALNLTVKTSELFTKDKGGKDFSQYKKVRDVAFSNDVINLQNNSDVIQISPEVAIVLRAKSHIQSTLLPLKDVSKQIEEKLKAAEAENHAAKFVGELKSKLQAGGNPTELASTLKLTWNKTGFIGRYSTKVDPAILDAAFSLQNPVKANKTTYGITRLSTGYAVVALKAVKDGNVTDKKQHSIFAEQVQNSEGLLEYELYKQSQVKNAKIEMEQ